MSDYVTVFGSLNDYRKGGVEVIDDDPRNYAFSNVFEVTSRASPYDRIAVAKNFEYVIEAVRAEGTSAWYTAAHDEFALSMDGSVEVRFIKLENPGVVARDQEGAIRLSGEPPGLKMGRIVLGRGHMALLATGTAYRFHAASPAVLILQTLEGETTIRKWAEICQSASGGAS